MHVVGIFFAAVTVTSIAAAQELPAVLTRVGEYVAAYERRFSVLVADEQYIQTIGDAGTVSNPGAVAFGRDGSGSAFPKGEGRRQQRTLRSDYLLVALPGGGWLPFRDVYNVDGSAIRDRSDRLAKLFLTEQGLARADSAAAFEQARSIMVESARYNIGDVERNINLPTLALLFAAIENQPRFTYRLERTDPDSTGQVLYFTERQRPTLIRTTNGRDLPVRGRFWMDPDGTIEQTEMIASDAQLSTTITVTYEVSALLGIRVRRGW